MSESNNNPKDSSGFRKLGKGDFAIVIGVIGVIVFVLIIAGGLIWYFRSNQPEQQEVAAPAADAAEETAGPTLLPPPPLAVLPAVSFPPDNPYSLSRQHPLAQRLHDH
jgi:flagellar basal body-associated protein FliL